MAARKLTAAQLRDRKTKRLAIALTVVLLAVLGFQAPTIMNLFGGSGGSGGSASTSAPLNIPAAAPGGVPSGLLAGGAPIAAGQLTGFAAFASKDPFHAPAASLAVTASAATTTPSATKTTTPSATKTTAPATAQAKSRSKSKSKSTKAKPKSTAKPKAPIPLGSPPASVPSASSATPPDAALIITNGKRQIVPIGGGFPRAQPLFKLVSLAAHQRTIRIAVLGGSFTNGVATLLVRRGTILTLANESDGLRYVIKLLRLTTAPTPGVPGTVVSAPSGSASSG